MNTNKGLLDLLMKWRHKIMIWYKCIQSRKTIAEYFMFWRNKNGRLNEERYWERRDEIARIVSSGLAKRYGSNIIQYSNGHPIVHLPLIPYTRYENGSPSLCIPLAIEILFRLCIIAEIWYCLALELFLHIYSESLLLKTHLSENCLSCESILPLLLRPLSV